MPFKCPDGYKEHAPRDFAEWVRTYVEDWHRSDFDVTNLAAWADIEEAQIDQVSQILTSLDEEGIGYDDVPPPLVSVLALTIDNRLFRAGVCLQAITELAAERDLNVDQGALGYSLARLAGSAWMLAIDHHVGDFRTEEPDAALLPEFFSLPERIREWMQEEHRLWWEKHDHVLEEDANGRQLSPREVASLNQLRRRLRDRPNDMD